MRHNAKCLCDVMKIVGTCVFLLLNGCERQESQPRAGTLENAHGNMESKIRQSMERLPSWLNCWRAGEARRLVTGNICENIRRIDDPVARRRHVSSYTNAVFCLDFPVDAALEDKRASRNVWVNLNAYNELIECGFAMLCDMEPMNPEMWDFFLVSPLRYKKALAMRTRRLELAGVPASRFRTDALFNELRDRLQDCSRIIEIGWYPSARRRMSASQLAEVRRKVKVALGELPPEMAKDE